MGTEAIDVKSVSSIFKIVLDFCIKDSRVRQEMAIRNNPATYYCKEVQITFDGYMGDENHHLYKVKFSYARFDNFRKEIKDFIVDVGVEFTNIAQPTVLKIITI